MTISPTSRKVRHYEPDPEAPPAASVQPAAGQPKPPKLDALAQINHHAAGLDIGDAEIYAAVPESAADPAVRVFRTFTPDLEALADWLAACHVDTVAMESTGVYWIPIYELLEDRGLQVYLVNARQLKNVSGKKTDILDCQWIQQLHTYGLLQPSFRPPEEICALRALVRQRGRLIQSCSTEIQHMQKALQQMNLKLTNVLSDITGLTGLAIIRDIVAGERDPHKLAAHRDPHCRKSAAEIAASLTGNYKREHLFALSRLWRRMISTGRNWQPAMPKPRAYHTSDAQVVRWPSPCAQPRRRIAAAERTPL